jgi:hypothetical protein
MNCHCVFDVTTAGFRAWLPISIGLSIFVLSLVIGIVQRSGSPQRWFPAAFAAVCTITIAAITSSAHIANVRAAGDHSWEVTTGYISSLEAVPPNRTGHASFMVAGRRFVFSNADLRSDFTETIRRNAGLVNGSFVRIYHRHGSILRVEVCAP